MTEEKIYYYDNNGNTVTKTSQLLKPSDGSLATFEITPLSASALVIMYTYDNRNQMLSVAQSFSTTESVYNGSGQRVSKTTDGTTEHFLYEGDKVILEKKGTVYTRNVHGINQISRESLMTAFYYVYNGHGDVTQILTEGVVTTSYYYDAFGNVIEESGTDDNPYRYSGYYYDKESKLYYLNARFYDPETARFLQRDTYRGNPANALSLNLYSYCFNNPIKYYDPTGHFAWGSGPNDIITKEEVKKNDGTVKIIYWITSVNDPEWSGTKDIRGKKSGANLNTAIEILGGNLYWNEKEGVALITLDGKSIRLQNGKDGVCIDKDGSLLVDEEVLIEGLEISLEKRKDSDRILSEVDDFINNLDVGNTGPGPSAETNEFQKEIATKALDYLNEVLSIVLVNGETQKKIEKGIKDLVKVIDDQVKVLGTDSKEIMQGLVHKIATENGFKAATKSGALDELLEVFDFVRDKKTGVFHTAQPDCWQDKWGYSPLYDTVFDLSTEMLYKNYPFETKDGRNFILWFWKGDYMNLGAGGEVGIYTGGDGYLWDIDKQYALKMTLNVLYKKESIIEWDPKILNWWITGFNPNYQSNGHRTIYAEDLRVYGYIHFSNNHVDLWDGFYERYHDVKGTIFNYFNEETHTVYYGW